MNNLEKKILDILEDLRLNYNVTSLKTEFEKEGASFEETLRLKEFAILSELDLTIKIGGCEAVKELYEAKYMDANVIIAPMIETPYALKKFSQAIERVFDITERTTKKFFINIETITGYKNLQEIVNSEYFTNISGIILGRSDMVDSMELPKEDIESEKILNIALDIADKIFNLEKEFIIGGEVSVNSIQFFNKLPRNTLNKFETRKIVFDAQKSIQNIDINKGIIKALEFEILWLKNKQENYEEIYEEDTNRLNLLQKRYELAMTKAGDLNE